LETNCHNIHNLFIILFYYGQNYDNYGNSLQAKRHSRARFRKPQGNRFLLVKFVDKIRFNYSNSFQKKKFVSRKKRPIRFQKKKSSFPENHPFVSRKTSQEKRLICFLEPRARVYSTETRK
jgi:hypothetical protein